MSPPPPIIVLLAISATVFLVSTNHAGATASRFLSRHGAKNKKCWVDAEVCNTPGSSGPTCCGGQCVDTSGDVLNCGHCGKICKFTHTCCAGKCVDTTYDKRNCGSCGHRCPAWILCFYGMCQYA
ncbi:hypothetical protein KSP39_PZI006122 [Platanthera zijinensis]|uniref:Stigma-specific Stig1 family protein n=1 Tax=Platanthera zijinensis TaxID=2320716 RepID=A0AAP0BSX3_9ASPA